MGPKTKMAFKGNREGNGLERERITHSDETQKKVDLSEFCSLLAFFLGKKKDSQ